MYNYYNNSTKKLYNKQVYYKNNKQVYYKRLFLVQTLLFLDLQKDQRQFTLSETI